MYERMLKRDVIPTMEEIFDYIGKQSSEWLTLLEKELAKRYDLIKELRFPYGNSYGWSFKYSHKKQHLCDLFFEKGAITVTISIPSKAVVQVNEILESLLPKTKQMWEERYPCGEGGWVNYRILNDQELMDVLILIAIKKKPVK